MSAMRVRLEGQALRPAFQGAGGIHKAVPHAADFVLRRSDCMGALRFKPPAIIALTKSG